MRIEHVNLAVKDARKSADLYEKVFGWHTRWEGEAMGGLGFTVHVGTDESYLALYSQQGWEPKADTRDAGFNHVGIVVADLDEIDRRLSDLGVRTFNHSSYEPGSRFYFLDPNDGFEVEVVSYK